jgi:hypothetical protein
MSPAKKLNLKDGMKIRVLGKPPDVALADLTIATRGVSDAILVFVKTLDELAAKGAPFIEAALADRIAWLAYPKAGQLGTDLNRDVLFQRLLKQDIQAVRQVSVDAVWSAMRFRPKA